MRTTDKCLDVTDKNLDLIYIGWSFSKIPHNTVIPLADKIRILRQNNVITVCPAGNDSSGYLSWPAAAPYAVAITSITKDDANPNQFPFSGTSNYANPPSHQKVPFCAFGGDDSNKVFTTSRNFGFYAAVGTSVSGAIATGIIAREITNFIKTQIDKEYTKVLTDCIFATELPSMKAPLLLPSTKPKADDVLNSLRNKALKIGSSLPDMKFGWGLIRN